MTTLSIALSTYNGEAFLEDQLRSYVAQTRPPDELVVRDDGSIDQTVDLLQSFAAEAPFPVRVIAGGPNVGYVRSFEAAIRASTGHLIALSDQDDVWLPHKLARLETALDQAPDALLAFSDAALIGADGRPVGSTVWDALQLTPALRQRVQAGGPETPLLQKTLVTGATVLFRSALIPLALPIRLDYWHDAWLALVASLHGPIALVDEPLVLYRQHSRNVLGAAPRLGSFERAVRHLRPSAAVEAEAVENLRRLSEMACRVSEQLGAAGALRPEARQALSEMHTFHAFRAQLPPYPHRAVEVARRVAERKYHRYGNGVRAAVRDLLRP